MAVIWRDPGGRFSRPGRSGSRPFSDRTGKELSGAAAASAVSAARQTATLPPLTRAQRSKVRRPVPRDLSPVFRRFIESIDDVSPDSTRQVYALVRFIFDPEFESGGGVSPPFEPVEDEEDGVKIQTTPTIPVKLPRRKVGHWQIAPEDVVVDIVEEATGKIVIEYLGMAVKVTDTEAKRVGKILGTERRRANKRKKLTTQGKGRVFRAT